MANREKSVRFIFNVGEISEEHAFRVYQAHIKKGKRESLIQINGLVYACRKMIGEYEHEDSDYIEIRLKEPDNIIQID